MFSFGERAGVFAIAAALLFAALRIHKSASRHTKVTKPLGLVIAFLAGSTFLITFVGDWIGGVRNAGLWFVAGIIVCGVIIAVDWLLDKKPDKPAFWASFVLPVMLVMGAASVVTAQHKVGDGVSEVSSTVKKAGSQGGK